ncbi:hypothetical protein AGMMS4952_07490 [Spirochaetia bacterium]|nr:hypothetical protein AGMMS4952_07490 [Spirochaetia bacterium]
MMGEKTFLPFSITLPYPFFYGMIVQMGDKPNPLPPVLLVKIKAYPALSGKHRPGKILSRKRRYEAGTIRQRSRTGTVPGVFWECCRGFRDAYYAIWKYLRGWGGGNSLQYKELGDFMLLNPAPLKNVPTAGLEPAPEKS